MIRSRLDTIAHTLDEQIDSAIRNIAEAIEAGAKSGVPVATGALQNSIHVVKVDEGSYAVVAGDDKAWYGHIVEHGSVNTPARPFLVPAVEAERDNIDEAARTALRDL